MSFSVHDMHISPAVCVWIRRPPPLRITTRPPLIMYWVHARHALREMRNATSQLDLSCRSDEGRKEGRNE